MRFTWILPVTAISSACSQQSPQQTQLETQQDVESLIASDDPKACASVEAIKTALSAANRQYGEALANGMPEIRTDTISATGVNKDIHEITCSATAYARTTFNEDQQTFPVVYKLRPALDQGGGFVAEVAVTPIATSMIAGHLRWWNNQNEGRQVEDTAPDENELASDYAATGPDGVANEDICNAEVLQEVASVEDPSSTMKPGERYSDVTQFWRNKETGETRFCQHGGYCYPSHVIINGEKVEAIRLLNCSIQGNGEDDGDEVMYGIW